MFRESRTHSRLARWYTVRQHRLTEGSRELHRRLLPLLILETHPFMRYILKRRGVFTSTVEQAPAGADALNDDDTREIATLLKAIEGDIKSYPFL